MKRILEIDYENGCVVVEPGVTNLNITKAVEPNGFYYAPDPSSQIACTIGGNVAENSGGLHCLKYGLTTNNLLGVAMVLPGGEIVTLGGKIAREGCDLLGLITGSEGLLGVVVEVVVKILRKARRPAHPDGRLSTEAGAAVASPPSSPMAWCPPAWNSWTGAPPRRSKPINQPGYPAGAEAILIIDADGGSKSTISIERVAAIVSGRGGNDGPRKPPTRSSAPASGRAARPPSPPWAGWRPT